MKYSTTISLNCPYCDTKTQFISDVTKVSFCKNENNFHDVFRCTNCGGLIVSKWDSYLQDYGIVNSVDSFKAKAINRSSLKNYYPIVGDFCSRIDLIKIINDRVRKDFKESIDCYNNGFYNASMVMARRAIHQEVENKEATGENLYKKIESLGISENLKNLLYKIKNFGNFGAHPDFFLYDESNNQLISEDNEKGFAKLCLLFLDKYFQDQYEIEYLISNAPKSKREIDGK